MEGPPQRGILQQIIEKNFDAAEGGLNHLLGEVSLPGGPLMTFLSHLFIGLDWYSVASSGMDSTQFNSLNEAQMIEAGLTNTFIRDFKIVQSTTLAVRNVKTGQKGRMEPAAIWQATKHRGPADVSVHRSDVQVGKVLLSLHELKMFFEAARALVKSHPIQ